MAIALASIMQESNTFSPVKTHYEDFSPVYGAAALERHRGRLTEMGGFIDVLSKARMSMAPVCAAWAITAGRCLRKDIERLAGEFLGELAALKRPEALLFALHGAQTAEGVDDVEGALLTRAREVLGRGVPIVVTLDLHANVTRAMVQNATAIIGYHTYPHIDMHEVGVKAARLLLRVLAGKVEPVMAFRKLPMIVPPENMQTTGGPMGRLIRRAQTLERSGRVRAASVFGVQPWLDIEEMGGSVVLVGDGNVTRTDAVAASLAKAFWESRREFDVRLTPPERAIREALRVPGRPVVLSESSDSTGSGSPGDSTGLLKALLAARLHEPAACFVVDPEAVAQAMRAGVGKAVEMRVGGKFDRKHSRPVKVRAYVRMLSDGRWTPRARGYNPGIETCMGRTTVLEVGAIRMLVAERSTMTVDPELYRSHGIEPLDMKIVAVKSPNGFRAAYGPIAKAMIMVDTPGVSTANLRTIPYRRVPRPIYPLDPGVRPPAGIFGRG
jgi:microcystin degradation protein MlrC